MIYHLVWKSEWDSQRNGEYYRAASLDAEGFIHCTQELDKLVEVANLFFAGEPTEPLLRLTIDPDKVTAEVRYEDPGVGHFFPHVYGPLETAAVVRVEAMQYEGGRWRHP